MRVLCSSNCLQKNTHKYPLYSQSFNSYLIFQGSRFRWWKFALKWDIFGSQPKFSLILRTKISSTAFTPLKYRNTPHVILFGTSKIARLLRFSQTVSLLHQALEEKLHSAWQELSKFQGHSNSLAAQLSTKEKELATKQQQLDQLW